MKLRVMLVLEAQPDTLPAELRLRGALKVLLRRFGLRCVELRPADPPEEPPAPAAPPGPPA